MYSSRFSVSLHILTLLAKAGNRLMSSAYIAGSLNINPVLVRKELVNLRRHRLIATKEGKHGGAYLHKPAGNIYLSDVYRAVHQNALGNKLKNKPNPQCPVGSRIEGQLLHLYQNTEKVILGSLAKTTLKKFAGQFP